MKGIAAKIAAILNAFIVTVFSVVWQSIEPLLAVGLILPPICTWERRRRSFAKYSIIEKVKQ